MSSGCIDALAMLCCYCSTAFLFLLFFLLLSYLFSLPLFLLSLKEKVYQYEFSKNNKFCALEFFYLSLLVLCDSFFFSICCWWYITIYSILHKEKLNNFK